MEAVEAAQGRGAGIAGLIAGALVARLPRVAAVWPLELAGQLGGPFDAGADDAEAVVRAAVSALRWDDLDPLLRLVASGTDPATLGVRLGHALACLDAVRRALMAVVEAEDIDARIVGALGRQAPTAFARAGRRLVEAALDGLAAPPAGEGEGDSLAITVHELRRPLTIVSSYAQLLDAGGLSPMPADAEPAVRSIAEATETMMRLVDDLATVARLGEPPARPAEVVAVTDLAGRAVAAVRAAAELHAVRIEVDVPEPLTVHAAVDDAVLALTNLLGNAVAHAPAGSAVRLAAVAEGAAVRITVADAGPGFAPADAERLFDKYFRGSAETERGVDGTGLGLYIVRAVAERHGGSATARLAPGGGAEFDLVLPA